jgi:hypothetical protein
MVIYKAWLSLRFVDVRNRALNEESVELTFKLSR